MKRGGVGNFASVDGNAEVNYATGSMISNHFITVLLSEAKQGKLHTTRKCMSLVAAGFSVTLIASSVCSICMQLGLFLVSTYMRVICRYITLCFTCMLYCSEQRNKQLSAPN